MHAFWPTRNLFLHIHSHWNNELRSRTTPACQNSMRFIAGLEPLIDHAVEATCRELID